jgi:hypothetical protein
MTEARDYQALGDHTSQARPELNTWRFDTFQDWT